MRSRKLSPFWHESQEEEAAIEPMDAMEALKFPIVAGCVLVGLYICIKYISPDLVNMLLSVYFLIIGIYCLKSYVYLYLKAKSLFEGGFKYTRSISIPYFVPKPELLELTTQDLVGYALATPIGLLYFYTKNWMLSNIFGLAFTIHAIENMPLGSFQVGYALLAGLIFYDVFFCIWD
jgi:minor histocompatibility antigen H13